MWRGRPRPRFCRTQEATRAITIKRGDPLALQVFAGEGARATFFDDSWKFFTNSTTFPLILARPWSASVILTAYTEPTRMCSGKS